MQIQKFNCEKCGHMWIPRVENPWKCPRCQHVAGTRIVNKKVGVAKFDGETIPTKQTPDQEGCSTK